MDKSDIMPMKIKGKDVISPATLKVSYNLLA